MQLYSEHIDNKGHQFGPTSAEVKRAVKEIDYHLDRFLTMLEQHQLNETVNLSQESLADFRNMKEIHRPESSESILKNFHFIFDRFDQNLFWLALQVNVMIVSGYGMAAGGAQSGVIYTEMDDYIDLDDVLLVIGRTTLAAVAPLPGKLEKVSPDYSWFIFPRVKLNGFDGVQVYNQLKRMPGVDVYRRDDIPDHYHYKNGRYVQQILVVARPGTHIYTERTTNWNLL